MNEELRVKIREEIKNYMEEEQQKKQAKELVILEKDAKILPLLMGPIVLLFSIIVSSVSNHRLQYYMYFAPLFLIATIVSILIIKSKKNPRTKINLTLLPNLIYMVALVLSTIMAG